MRKSNIEQVRSIVAGNHKKSKSYFMSPMKSNDERVAGIRKGKKEGDIWKEGNTNMTLYNGCYMSEKAKYFQQIREENKMPNKCPECGKEMKKQYDERPWRLEGKCWDCVIEEEGRMRIKGTWKAYVEKRLRKNALAQIKDNKQLLEENLKNLKKEFEVIGNETGELETWTATQKSVDVQKKMLETQITQLNLMESKLLKEEAKIKENEQKKEGK